MTTSRKIIKARQAARVREMHIKIVIKNPEVM
jgi:hypothetical protein